MSDNPGSATALISGDIGAIRAAIEARVVLPSEVAEASLALLAGAGDLNAVIELCPAAVEEAAAARGTLAGVPVVVKDCFVDRGRAPTVGSRARARWLRGTAEVLKRLRSAGATIVGYANLHEWMVGTTSLVSAFGPIRNPRDRALIAGGSSGGSAAALAVGSVPLALGSDAGGSIRIPAACCGVVGLKPTWGLVPTEGFADHGSAIDHVGPMARSVADVITLLEVLTGSRVDLPETSALRVGLARSYFLENVDPDVEVALERAMRSLEAAVASVHEVSVAHVEEARVAVARFILRDVASMLTADRSDWQEFLAPETALVLGMGAAVSDEDRREAGVARRRIRAGWDAAFEEVDVIVTPTLPGRIATAADRTITLPTGRVSAEREYVAWNAPMNLGGVPCLSLPFGSLPDGQNFNVSLTAARNSDAKALALGLLLQSLS